MTPIAPLAEMLDILDETPEQALEHARHELRTKKPLKPPEGLPAALVSSLEAYRLHWRQQALEARRRILLVGAVRCVDNWAHHDWWMWRVSGAGVGRQLTADEMHALAGYIGRLWSAWRAEHPERVFGAAGLVRPWLWPEVPVWCRGDWESLKRFGLPGGPQPIWPGESDEAESVNEILV